MTVPKGINVEPHLTLSPTVEQYVAVHFGTACDPLKSKKRVRRNAGEKRFMMLESMLV